MRRLEDVAALELRVLDALRATASPPPGTWRGGGRRAGCAGGEAPRTRLVAMVITRDDSPWTEEPEGASIIKF